MFQHPDERIEFDTKPGAPGWYGIISTDGEREVWMTVDYWDGASWQAKLGHKCAYARSVQAFLSEETARDWVSSQPD